MATAALQDLRSRLERFERVPLAAYPTPLEPLPRLSAELCRPVWIKRDDTLGPGLGGNKTRKLEYLLAEAQRQGHRRVVTFGGLQSNHARLTAAAANRVGMETHLFYFEPRPAKLTGNLAINRLLGAKMHFIPLGGSGSGMTLEQTIRLVRWVARLRVGRHFFIPVGGHDPVGCLGYVAAALEIEEQRRALDIGGPDGEAWLVTAAGSGGTLAGLAAGLALAQSPLRALGIDVGKLWKGFPASICLLAGQSCSRLQRPLAFRPEEILLIEERYVGERYGAPSPAGLTAMRWLAECEGILLDPVYTAKAFAGMLDLIERGELGPRTPVIFLHTGGLPATFAFEAAQLGVGWPSGHELN
jgi:1-aminocyclopropane-1-carboxylate deaminase/D-cysteine desulfhydrase-like pyridoxal-dependent ACC family enzyme